MASTEPETVAMSTSHAAHSAPEEHPDHTRPETPGPAFGSILFADLDAELRKPGQPAFFADLHLDQIVAAATAGRDEYELAELYHQPLRTAAEVRYRQEVVADLDREPVRDAVTSFAEAMQTMRRQLGLAGRVRHSLQRQRWSLEAANVYCTATEELSGSLQLARVSSRGLRSLTRHLAALVAGEAFRTFAAQAREVSDELGALPYTVNIKGLHVQVDVYDGQDDLSADVRETFARFQQGAVTDYRRRLSEYAAPTHVDEQIEDRVATLFPEPFARLHDFCTAHVQAYDGPLLRFDREVQFYLGYMEYIAPLAALGMGFCTPEIDAEATEISVEDGLDLSLAAKLARERRTPVSNDYRLESPQRVLVVTGPNQGGKTTFARMIGQHHYLAALGLPVPARKARLLLCDQIFSHFEREESIDTLRGKFEDELVRIQDVLQHATERSLLIMNESFGSTTLADGLLIGSEIVRQIIATGSACVFVTFIDELASVGPQTVSMMSTIVVDDPAQRTFRIERRPADGLAFAAALATKYRLGYDELRARVAR
jgi:hypothetical protein